MRPTLDTIDGRCHGETFEYTVHLQEISQLTVGPAVNA
jgi:hypothetical protein